MATAGQCEIDMRFAPLLRNGRQADLVQVHRQERRPPATARPSPSCPSRSSSDNGSGMHLHISLWKEGEPLFAGDGYGGLSRHGAARHRRHPQALGRPCSPSAARRRTGTTGSSPASRRRSIWPTAAQPLGGRSASRCTRRARRPSGSSSAVPIRRRNPYLAFRPC